MNIIEAVQREIDARGYKDVTITRQTTGNKAGIGLRSPDRAIAFCIRELDPGDTLDDRSESAVRAFVYDLCETWESGFGGTKMVAGRLIEAGATAIRNDTPYGDGPLWR
jgi:hypothetical protein